MGIRITHTKNQFYLFNYYIMEKLLQLLNEYQTQRGSKFKFSSYDERSQSFLLVDSNEVLWEETIISKKFWFIQWLADNDRIDYYKVGEIVDTYKWSLREKAYVVSDCVYESMLMILAIQDDPISFLVSILK